MVTDTQWISKLFGHILSLSSAKESNGMIRRSDLRSFWKAYPEDVKDTFAGMLESLFLGEWIDNRCIHLAYSTLLIYI